MKTVIISDTHLTHKFDQKRFEYLKKIVSSADQVIINGDFIDLYATKFNKFINSQWQELFALLKSKNTIYLFGNHDPYIWMDERVNDFSVSQGDIHTLPWKDTTLHISHGHEIIPTVGDYVPNWIARRAALGKMGIYRDQFGTLLRGKRFLERYRKLNTRVKKWVNDNLSEDTIYICGHTHFAEIDLKNRFINSGFIQHGIGQYITVREDTLEVVDERY
ncbi:hypothetical protein HGA91_03210 [candidate division WWE3 bacterium]|nr:hypothetical protein [candidate division WWE3 bacterium]